LSRFLLRERKKKLIGRNSLQKKKVGREERITKRNMFRKASPDGGRDHKNEGPRKLLV